MGRLIDADALKELFSEVIGRIAIKPEMNGNLEHMVRASAMVIQMIDDAPTVNALNCSEIPNNCPAADVVPVVRRKDCKWYGRADKRRFYRGMDCLQKRIDTIVPDRDFCSRAERREK